MQDEIDVLWGRDSGGQIVGTSAAGSPPYHCVQCGGRMALKAEHIRRRKRNGIVLESKVRTHFMHTAGRPDTCTNESIEHKVAKNIVKVQRPVVFFRCTGCERDMEIDYTCEGRAVGREEEPLTRAFRLDVGFVDEGAVVGAVEVYKTHRISDEKAAALTGRGVAWVEVSAKSIIEASDSPAPVRALRCARDLCAECEAREKEVRERDERLRVMTTARIEALERVQAGRNTFDAAAILKEMEERTERALQRSREGVQQKLFEDVMTAIRSLRKTAGKQERRLVQQVLCPSPHAIGWGDKYHWLSPKEIALKDAQYFASTLCASEEGPPAAIREACMDARALLRLCLTCYAHNSTSNGEHHCGRCHSKTFTPANSGGAWPRFRKWRGKK